MLEKHKNQEGLLKEIDQMKDSLENSMKKASDLEQAYEREEKTKNELFGEIGSLEDRSNHIKDLLRNAKLEIEDYQGMLAYYKVFSCIFHEFIIFLKGN